MVEKGKDYKLYISDCKKKIYFREKSKILLNPIGNTQPLTVRSEVLNLVFHLDFTALIWSFRLVSHAYYVIETYMNFFFFFSTLKAILLVTKETCRII